MSESTEEQLDEALGKNMYTIKAISIKSGGESTVGIRADSLEAAKEKFNNTVNYGKKLRIASIVLKEEAEDLQELSHGLLKRYVRKALADKPKTEHLFSDANKRAARRKHLEKREDGVISARDRLEGDYTNFKVNYKKNDGSEGHRTFYVYDKEEAKQKFEKWAKHEGIKNTTPTQIQIINESVEDLQELSKNTLASYVKKAAKDVRFHSSEAAYKDSMSNDSNQRGMKKDLEKDSDRHTNTAKKRGVGIDRATDRLAGITTRTYEASFILNGDKSGFTHHVKFKAESPDEAKTKIKSYIKQKYGAAKNISKLKLQQVRESVETLDEAYMSQDKKKQIAVKVKDVLKKYGVSGSLGVRNSSTIVLKITKGKLDFNADVNRDKKSDYFDISKLDIHLGGKNVYKSLFHPGSKSEKFFVEVEHALNDGNHDRSDSMTDYFDVGWYVDIKIGDWNKPYTLIK